MSELSFQISIHKHGLQIVEIDRFTIAENRITFLFGESGIGKSMIARTIFGLLDPEEFEITVNRESYIDYRSSPFVDHIRQTGSFVFQEPSTHLNPLMTLKEQLNEGSLKNAPSTIDNLLKLWQSASINVRKILQVYPKPYRPSGGEKQRILATMAFTKMDQLPNNDRASFLFVFDEPTGNLDNELRNTFLALLFEKFRSRSCTVLLITHDYSMISEIISRHRSMTDAIIFNELSLDYPERLRVHDRQDTRSSKTNLTATELKRSAEYRSGLYLHEFQPDLYTSWLSEQHPATQHSKSQSRQIPLIQVVGETKIYDRTLVFSKDREGKNVVPLQIFPDSLVYLKAPSGVGKTTIAKIMMGLIQSRQFCMNIGGITITQNTRRKYWQKHLWGKVLAMVFQHADESLNLKSNVRDVFKGLPISFMLDDQMLCRFLQTVFDVPITRTFLDKKVSALSGGQKQKINLMRGMLLETDVLILDEPLSGMDFVSIRNVLTLISEKRKQGKAIMLISHNEEIFDAIVPPEYVYYVQATIR
jgi:ABC-type glutathione transport system ATPase component